MDGHSIFHNLGWIKTSPWEQGGSGWQRSLDYSRSGQTTCLSITQWSLPNSFILCHGDFLFLVYRA